MDADQPHTPAGRAAGTGRPDGDDGSWIAPGVTGPVSALVRLPGSKSMTNRALVLAALAEGPTQITGPLAARDTALMVAALRALGCGIQTGRDLAGPWLAEPGAAPGGLAGWPPAGSSGHDGELAGREGAARSVVVNVGNAGTVLRFVPAIAALTSADVRFIGDERVAERPLLPMLSALRELGAQIEGGGNGTVPFVVRGGGGLPGGAVTLDASSSSQLISGLLLAAPRYGKGVEVRHQGPPVPSAPHIEMTVAMLRARGVDVTAGTQQAGATPANDAGLTAGPDAMSRPPAAAAITGDTGGERAVCDTWAVLPGAIAAGTIDVEPDLSNAVPFLAAALAIGGEVTIAGWPTASLQPVARVLGLLAAMGATVSQTAAGLRVSGDGRIRGITADLSEVGELTPVLTALAALASSPSRFVGVGHLRRHECDRLAALAGEIGGLGGDVTELPDGLSIRPRPLRSDGVVFDSHDDHRLVMAAAVLGLATGGLRIGNAATAGKTFPGFARFWTQTLAPAG
jgi:3-phosphoshikimate 1-carboxyvinyltransferase